MAGIEQVSTKARYETILDETKAINTALDQAPKGSLVVIFPESVSRSLKMISERQPIEQEAAPSTQNSWKVRFQIEIQPEEAFQFMSV